MKFGGTFLKLCFAVFAAGIPILAKAQLFNLVTHTSGTQIINGIPVTVVPINSPTTGTWCCVSPYHIGHSANNAYKFIFDVPVKHIRTTVSAIDSGERISYIINGTQYLLTSGNITSFSCSSCTSATSAFVTIVSGNLTSNTPVPLGGSTATVNITSTVPIDSIRVQHLNVPINGCLFNFYFGNDTSVHVKKPFYDTSLCRNDSLKLKYLVAGSFRTNNLFTAQLSDSTGNFTNALTIGTKNDSLSDTINCKIPANMPIGSGYRIRILASNPADTSIDNGKNIQIKPLPTFTVTSNSPVCLGATLYLSGSSSTGGLGWSWAGSGSFSSSSQNPSRSNMTVAEAGKYITTATLNGCSAKDSLNVTVNPVTPTPTAGSNSPVCVGGSINLTASAVTGATYSWTGPNGFGSTQQNPVRSNVTSLDAGTYSVTVTVNGCVSPSAGTTTVAVNTGPSVSAYVNPGDTICIGDTAKFVALPFNAGSSPTYQWYRNGNLIPGATMTPYATNNIADGDVFYALMTAGTACNTPIQSNSIKMTVLQKTGPTSVKITVAPDSVVWAGLQLTFTALPVNCRKPQYQWKRNGVDIVGGTVNPLPANHLSNGDKISCVVTCYCGDPGVATSNTITMSVDTKVSAVKQGESDIIVYPNPTTGELFINYSTPLPPPAGDTRAELRNLFGQIVLKQDLSLMPYPLQLNISNLPTGTYMLQLQSADGYRMNVKVVKE
jgi:hypothetical protein